MTHSTRFKRAAAILGIATGAAVGTVALASPPSGVSGQIFVTADLDEAEHLNSDRIKFQTKDPTDIRMQRLDFAAGSTTGWHHHPGMVIVTVASGTLTLWDEDCSTTDYGPGSQNGAVFIEALPHAHQATSAGGATVYVTYVSPDGAGFRKEEDPPACAS